MTARDNTMENERARGDAWTRPERALVEPRAEPEAQPSHEVATPSAAPVDPKAAHDLFGHYADDLGTGLQTKARAHSRTLPATAAPKTAAPARIAALAATLEEHLTRANELLASNQAQPAPLAALDQVLEQLSTGRDELQSAAEQLPSGHPAMRSAFALSDRVSVAIEQLRTKRKSSLFAEVMLPSGSLLSRCEQAPAATLCFLPDANREERRETFRDNTLTAQDSFHGALDSKRLEVLLAKTPKLGMLAEVLINLLGTVTGGLLNGALARALNNLNARAAWAGVIRASDMEGAIKSQSSVFKAVVSESISIGKAKVKSAFSHLAPQAQLKDAFLRTLQNEIGPTFSSIRSAVLGRADDLTLLLACEVFDPKVFNVDYCAGLIDAKLAAFESQHLDEIGPLKVGPVSNAGSTEVVRLHAFGKDRLAVVKFYESKPLGRGRGDVWYTPSGQTFLNWVDGDFAEFATATQEARNGAMKTIDVTGEHRLGAEVAKWAQEARGEGPDTSGEPVENGGAP
ncbi:MAG: hypothetical protein ACTHU0_05195 [Kofleriaceae bacterium]